MDDPIENQDNYQDELGALARVAAVVGSNKRQIGIVLLSVAFGLLLVMVAVYTIAPARKVASLPFRLEFQGAEQGTYPNGMDFSVSEIVTTAVLLKAYETNGLEEYLTFDDFSDSIYVVESNEEMQRVANEFRARLADPRLNAVDRERIEGEYQQKIASLSRSKYALNFSSVDDSTEIPVKVLQKVLPDILQIWAEHAKLEKGVVRYLAPILTTNILSPIDTAQEPLIALDLLRSKIFDVIRNIDLLRTIPGADVLRTSEGASLAETRLKLEDLIRLRLRPLANYFIQSGAIRDKGETIQFFESQVSHNNLRMAEAKATVGASREALVLYSSEQDRSIRASEDAGSETVMPQIGETFLDRLVDLANQPQERAFREDLVEEIRIASLAVIPYQSEVNYYEELLDEIRGASSGASMTAAETQRLREELRTSEEQVREALDQVGEIYTIISENLNSSNQLYRTTGPVGFEVLRPISAARLALIALVLFLLAIPLTILVILIQNRMHMNET